VVVRTLTEMQYNSILESSKGRKRSKVFFANIFSTGKLLGTIKVKSKTKISKSYTCKKSDNYLKNDYLITVKATKIGKRDSWPYSWAYIVDCDSDDSNIVVLANGRLKEQLVTIE